MIGRHTIAGSLRALASRAFSDKLKKPDLANAVGEYKRFNMLRKRNDEQKLAELRKERETSLTKDMDCYQHETRLELMYPIQDETSTYVESVFNFHGVLHRKVVSKEQRSVLSGQFEEPPDPFSENRCQKGRHQVAGHARVLYIRRRKVVVRGKPNPGFFGGGETVD